MYKVIKKIEDFKLVKNPSMPEMAYVYKLRVDDLSFRITTLNYGKSFNFQVTLIKKIKPKFSVLACFDCENLDLALQSVNFFLNDY